MANVLCCFMVEMSWTKSDIR
eukprot:gene18742-24507_t